MAAGHLCVMQDNTLDVEVAYGHDKATTTAA